MERELESYAVIVLHESGVLEAFGADKIHESDLTWCATPAGISRRSHTHEEAGESVASGSGIAGNLRTAAKVEVESAGWPAGLSEVYLMQAPVAAEFKFMLIVDPTERAIEIMDNLAFLENAERIGSDIGVVAGLIRRSISINDDSGKSTETVIEV